MTERLVAVASQRVMGYVTRQAGGRLSFAYDAGWRLAENAYPLSLSMPLAAAEHGHDKIEPWLWGLLPDNENVLARWGRNSRYRRAARLHCWVRPGRTVRGESSSPGLIALSGC